MKINYKCECSKMMEALIELVLLDSKVSPTEFDIVSGDDRRIYLRTKLWDENAEPAILGMMKGCWEGRTWVIKYEFQEVNECQTFMHYILFDTKISEVIEYPSNGKWEFFSLLPTVINRGTYQLDKISDTIRIRRVVYK